MPESTFIFTPIEGTRDSRVTNRLAYEPGQDPSPLYSEIKTATGDLTSLANSAHKLATMLKSFCGIVEKSAGKLQKESTPPRSSESLLELSNHELLTLGEKLYERLLLLSEKLQKNTNQTVELPNNEKELAALLKNSANLEKTGATLGKEVVTLKKLIYAKDELSSLIETLNNINGVSTKRKLEAAGFKDEYDLRIARYRAQRELRSEIGFMGIKKLWNSKRIQDKTERLKELEELLKATSNPPFDIRTPLIKQAERIKTVPGVSNYRFHEVMYCINAAAQSLVSNVQIKFDSRQSLQIENFLKADTVDAKLGSRDDLRTIMGRTLKRKFFYPKVESLRDDPSMSEQLSRAEALIDNIIGSGNRTAMGIEDSENHFDYEILQHLHGIILNRLDPLVDCSQILLWACIAPECASATDAINELKVSLGRIQKDFQEIIHQDVKPQQYVADSLQSAQQRIEALAPTAIREAQNNFFRSYGSENSPDLKLWTALRQMPEIEKLLTLIREQSELPTTEGYLENVDQILGLTVLSGLQVSQEHVDSTIHLGQQLLYFSHPKLLAFQIMNAFREPGHSGEMPFATTRFHGDSLNSVIVQKILDTDLDFLHKTDISKIPGLIDTFMILRQHRDEAIKLYESSNSSNDFSLNPLRVALEVELSKVCYHYLTNGNDQEKQFCLALIPTLRTGISQEVVAALNTIIAESDVPNLTNEALRVLKKTIPYSDVLPAEVSKIAILRLGREESRYLYGGDIRSQIASHALRLSKEELLSTEIQLVLCKEFNVEPEALNRFVELQEFLLEHGFISDDNKGSQQAEEILSGALQIATIPNYKETLLRLKNSNYEFKYSDASFLKIVDQTADIFFEQLETMLTDLKAFDSSLLAYTKFRPKEIQVTTQGDLSEKIPLPSPYFSDMVTSVISPQKRDNFINFIFQRYGEIPTPYVKAIVLHCGGHFVNGTLPNFDFTTEELEIHKAHIATALNLEGTNTEFQLKLNPVILDSNLGRRLIFSRPPHKEICHELESILQSVSANPEVSLVFSKYILNCGFLTSRSEGNTLDILNSLPLASDLFRETPALLRELLEYGNISREPLRTDLNKVLAKINTISFLEPAVQINIINFLKEHPDRMFSILRILPEDFEQLRAFSKPHLLKTLIEAFPSHPNLDDTIRFGIPVLKSRGYFTPENLEELAKIIPEMLRRNAANSDCWSAYSKILTGKAAYNLPPTTLLEELTSLMNFNQHFPGLGLTSVYIAMKYLPLENGTEILCQLGIDLGEAKTIGDLKAKMQGIKEKLLTSEDAIQINSKLEEDFLLAALSYTGEAYNIRRAVDSFNEAKTAGRIVKLDPKLENKVIKVARLNLEKVREFAFSEASDFKYNEYLRLLEDVRNTPLVTVLQNEKKLVITKLHEYIHKLEIELQNTVEVNEKAKKGRELELTKAKNAVLDLDGATTPKEIIEAFLSFKQRDNEITSPSLKRILLRLALDELSNADEFFRNLTASPEKNAVESLVALIQTNLQEEALPALKLDKNLRKACSATLSIGAFLEDLDKLSNIDTLGFEDILVHPTRGVLAELSGYNCGACWIRELGIMEKYPNITALMFVKNHESTQNRIVGACMQIEAKDSEGNKVLIIRGINPTQNTITALSSESFFESFVDTVLIDYAKALGIKKIVIPAGESGAGGSQTNRPDLHLYIEKKYGEAPRVTLDPDSGTTFNSYMIEHKCRLVRELE